MPLAATIVQATAGIVGGPYSLWVDGVDVLRDRAPGGNGYSVPIDSIEVTQAGPGGISGMTFELRDPANEIAIAGGEYVLYWDHTRGCAEFAGWAMTPTTTPFGIGRSRTIECVGIETLLDWTRLAAPAVLDWPAAALTGLDGFLAQLLGQAPWRWPVTWASTVGGPVNGDADFPLSDFDDRTQFYTHLPMTIAAGTTLRDAIDQAIAAWLPLPNQGPYVDRVTIDYMGRVRGWAQASPADFPADYVGLTVAASYGAAIVPAAEEHVVDAGAAVRSVLVTGSVGNVAVVSDGSGIPGQMDSISVNAASAEGCARAGAAYLAAHRPVARGTLALEDWLPVAGVLPGASITITDGPVGSTGVWFLGELVRTYTDAGRVNLAVTYGALAPSYIDRKGR